MVNRPIALLTDFGLKDSYVGSMKGVILQIHPKAVILDMTHDIRPRQVREAALVLDAVYPDAPKGTVFVAVVDPGVGSKRRAVCVRTKKGFLVGPDNGIFSWVLKRESAFEAREICNDRFFRKPVSPTFHGRDIFSPVAAWLSKKEIFSRLGPPLQNLKRFEIPEVGMASGALFGEVVYLDRFGNAMTNISIQDLSSAFPRQDPFSPVGEKVRMRGSTLRFIPHPNPLPKGERGDLPSSFEELGSEAMSKARKAVFRSKIRVRVCSFFGEGRAGELIGFWNGNQVFELAVKEDSAERRFRIKIGDPVSLLLK